MSAAGTRSPHCQEHDQLNADIATIKANTTTIMDDVKDIKSRMREVEVKVSGHEGAHSASRSWLPFALAFVSFLCSVTIGIIMLAS